MKRIMKKIFGPKMYFQPDISVWGRPFSAGQLSKGIHKVIFADEKPKQNKHFTPEMLQTYADKEDIMTESKHQQHLESNTFVDIWWFMNKFMTKFFSLDEDSPTNVVCPPTPQFFRRAFTLNGSDTERFVFNQLEGVPNKLIADSDEVPHDIILFYLFSGGGV